MQNWFEISTQNLDISIKAYLQTTYGFWSVGRTESKPYTSIFVENFSDWFQENEISIKSIFPKKIQKFLESMTYYGVVAMGEGQLFWGCLLLVLILCILNKRGIWIVFAPGFGGWLTIMISTPIAYQWRYVLYLALMLPLFIGMILLPKSGQSVYENSNRI